MPKCQSCEKEFPASELVVLDEYIQARVCRACKERLDKETARLRRAYESRGAE